MSPSARVATSDQRTQGSPSLSRKALVESSERWRQPTSLWARSTKVGLRAQLSEGPLPIPLTGRAQPTTG